MTTTRPPVGAILSVRLDPEIAEALDRHCALTGRTRSHVVQEQLAQYLVKQPDTTLSSLAEALLPPLPVGPARSEERPTRQQRFREHVRAKRRR